MVELDKVLKNTKEEKFIEYLDFYQDAEYSVEMSDNVYTYHFLDQGIYPPCNVTLSFSKQGRLQNATCDCDDEDDGYCVHIFAAYINYYMSKHPNFSILNYIIDKTRDVDSLDDLWLEPLSLDFDDDEDDYYYDDEDLEDNFLEGLGLEDDEIEAIKNFDITEPLHEMSKEEIINLIMDVCEDFGPLRYMILERLALDFMDEHLDDDYQEEDLDDFLYDLKSKHKPS